MSARQVKTRETARRGRSHGVIRGGVAAFAAALVCAACVSMEGDAGATEVASVSSAERQRSAEVTLLVPRKIRFIIGYQKIKTA
ncbi:MAG: hypothetical protein ACF8GE_04425 [Phycisphaerales bacterium JB043]